MAVKYSATYTSIDNNTYVLNISLDGYAGAVIDLELLFDNVTLRCISENDFFALNKDQDLSFSVVKIDDLVSDVNDNKLTCQLFRDGVLQFDGIIDNKDTAADQNTVASQYRVRAYSFFKVLRNQSFIYQHGGFNPTKIKDIFIYCIQRYLTQSELSDIDLYVENRTFYDADLNGANSNTIYLKDFYVDIARFSESGSTTDCVSVINSICNDFSLTAVWWGKSLYVIHVDDIFFYSITDSIQKYNVTSSSSTDEGLTTISQDITNDVSVISDYTTTLQSYDSISITSSLKERGNFLQGGGISGIDIEQSSPNQFFIKGWQFNEDPDPSPNPVGSHRAYYNEGDENVILWYEGFTASDFEIVITSSANNAIGVRLNSKYSELVFESKGVFVGDQSLTPTDITFSFSQMLLFLVWRDDNTDGDTYRWDLSSEKWVLYTGVNIGGGLDSQAVDRINDSKKEFNVKFTAPYPSLDNMYNATTDGSPTPPSGVSSFDGEGKFGILDYSNRIGFPIGATFGNDKESYPLNYTLKIKTQQTFNFRDNLRDGSLFSYFQGANPFSEIAVISSGSLSYTRTLKDGANVFTKTINGTGGYDVKLPNGNVYSVPELEFTNIYMVQELEGVFPLQKLKYMPMSDKLYFALGTLTPRKIEDFNIIKVQKAFGTDVQRKDIELCGDVDFNPLKRWNNFFMGGFTINTHRNEFQGIMYQYKTSY